MKPDKIQQIRNRLTFANEVGGASNKFNGVDVTVNARLRDVTLQGGTSTGNVVEDSCGVVTENPEYYIFGPWGGTGGFLDTFLGGIGQWPQQFCHRESGWKTNIKGLASYTVPKIDVLVSGTFKSLPYPGNEFPSVQSQSLGGQVLVFNIPGVVNTSGLNRPFSSGNRRPVPEHRRARKVIRRSPELDRSPVRQDPALWEHTVVAQLRRLQPVQREHDRGLPAELLGSHGSGRDTAVNVSRSAVDHVGAVLQDQRAVRFLASKPTWGPPSGGPHAAPHTLESS